jgi:hypothetical protein
VTTTPSAASRRGARTGSDSTTGSLAERRVSSQSSTALAVFALSLCREIVLRHGGTSTERKREKPRTSGRGSELQVDDAVLATVSRAARAGAARRWMTGLGRVESQDGVASCRTRVARASPVCASRRPMTADGLDIGDDGANAVLLVELLNRDHARRLAAAGVTAAFGDRRATRTMVALTARIDRRPTHCSGSPMPSPQ